MSSVSSSKNRYEAIRDQKAPVGIRCPACQTSSDIYYSSAQLRRPIYKRVFFCYLRCHSCTHRFRIVRVGSLVFAAAAAVIFVFSSVLG